MKYLHIISKFIFSRFKRGVEVLMPLFGMSIKPFYDKTDFPWLELLENNYLEIRQEMLAVYDSGLIPSVHGLNKNASTYVKEDEWKIFNLWVYGTRIDKNCAWCPFTENIIKQVPDFHTAFFSILEPGKNIAEHTGVYRGNTFAHLALVVPDPVTQCTFYVKNIPRHWEEGRAFAFEDSYRHYVINNASTFRVVLIIEFRRKVPFLLKPFDLYIQHVIRNSYITKNILKALTG